MTRSIVYTCLAFFLCFPLLPAKLNAESLSPAWVELGEGGRSIARIVVSDAKECPSIQVDGRGRTMSLRQPVPDGLRPACEFAIPLNAKSVSINGQTLTLPKSNPSKVIALGDTGCRIKDTHVQGCNNPDQWPFQLVATRAAAEKPDLVIHVGDYLYREIPCPSGSEALCGGTPSGDNWETWNADFFKPPAKLLAAAPWAFSRGNHEDCNRAWRGWFYYLDPRAWHPVCESYSAPYVITLGKLQLAMLDSSAVVEDKLDDVQVHRYVEQFKSLHVKNAWLVDHHPFWGFKQSAGSGAPTLVSLPLEAAWDEHPPEGIDMVLSGHVHLFELLSFDHGRPTQLVAGTGGTDLAMSIEKSVNGTLVHGATVITSGSQSQFGYTLLSRNGARWNLSLKSRSGEVLFSCALPIAGPVRSK